ncbi:MAG: metallophosphoesterase [bacterium]
MFNLFMLVVITGPVQADRYISTSRNHYRLPDRPDTSGGFSFVVLGDRTDGFEAGIPALKKGVKIANLLSPELVMTVGDLVQGGQVSQWVHQAIRYRDILSNLDESWYPVPGNHDIGGKRRKQYESMYENHFGPLWYAFQHRNSWFVVLYTVEGNLTFPGEDSYSTEQIRWLRSVLWKARRADHVFVFMHYPRWLHKTDKWVEAGENWQVVQNEFEKAGNVSAVFGGHIHRMTHRKINGVEYITTATTGGKSRNDSPKQGFLHHLLNVEVTADTVKTTSVPLNQTFSPRDVNQSFERSYERDTWPILSRRTIQFNSDNSRRMSFPFKVPENWDGDVLLRVGIEEASDNSGDYGIHYRLVNRHDQVIRSSFIGERSLFWIEKQVKPGSQWKLILEDQDTSLSGKWPGNEVSIQAFVVSPRNS